MKYQARSGYGPPLSLCARENKWGWPGESRTDFRPFRLRLELVYLVLPHGGRDFLTGGDFGAWRVETFLKIALARSACK